MVFSLPQSLSCGGVDMPAALRNIDRDLQLKSFSETSTNYTYIELSASIGEHLKNISQLIFLRNTRNFDESYCDLQFVKHTSTKSFPASSLPIVMTTELASNIFLFENIHRKHSKVDSTCSSE